MRFNIFHSLGGLVLGAVSLISANVAQATPIVVGDPLSGGVVDSWNAIMVISENDAYTNVSGGQELVTLDAFNFTVGANRGRVTPFVVRINNAATNDFTIMAIGDTRSSGTDYLATGNFSFDFSAIASSFILEVGETITSGFLDASASGVSNDSVIPFTGGDSVFLTGGWHDSHSANLNAGIGGAPTPGSYQPGGQYSRNYSYNITANVSAVPEPAGIALLGLGLLGLGLARKRRS